MGSCLPVPWTSLGLLFWSSRSLFCYLPTFFQDLYIAILWLLQPRLWWTFTALTSSSWLMSSRLSRVSLLIDLSISFFKKLFSRIAFLDCLHPSFFSSQQLLGWWKPPGRNRACNQKASPSWLQLISSTFSQFWWPVADTHYTIRLVGLLSCPDL